MDSIFLVKENEKARALVLTWVKREVVWQSKWHVWNMYMYLEYDL